MAMPAGIAEKHDDPRTARFSDSPAPKTSTRVLGDKRPGERPGRETVEDDERSGGDNRLNGGRCAACNGRTALRKSFLATTVARNAVAFRRRISRLRQPRLPPGSSSKRTGYRKEPVRLLKGAGS